MSSLNVPFIHKILRQSNLMEPYSKYVGKDIFPEQNTDLLNSVVSIKYRNQERAELEKYNMPAIIKDNKGNKISSRPRDDIEFSEIDIKDGDDNIVYEDNFIILRADISEPYRYIAISKDFNIVISGYIDRETNTIDKSKYPVHTEEIDFIIESYCNIKDLKSGSISSGIVFSSNAVEPLNTIICEYIDDNTIRFIFSDELHCEYDPDLVKKITSPDDHEFKYKVNIRYKTKNEIIKFRKDMLEKYTIYQSKNK